jgi:hypothetical protein
MNRKRKMQRQTWKKILLELMRMRLQKKPLLDFFITRILAISSPARNSLPSLTTTSWPRKQSRKLKSRYGARNQFQEPSLELVAKLHRLAGRYDNHMPTWFLAPKTGLKLPSQTAWTMDQISIKTPNPICRLCWCLIEFIDRRCSQLC